MYIMCTKSCTSGLNEAFAVFHESERHDAVRYVITLAFDTTTHEQSLPLLQRSARSEGVEVSHF